MNTNENSAPGADQLSSRFDVSTSPAIACQTMRAPIEPALPAAICKTQAGGQCVTRRTIMNIAVSSAALVAAPSIVLVDNTDANIIASGNKFEELFSEYMPLWLEWAKLSRRARAETEAKFGSDHHSPAWSKPSLGESPAHLFLMEAHDRLGASQVDRAMFAVDEEMSPIAELIREADVQSVTGLRAKALVTMWGGRPFCSSHSGELVLDREDDFRSLLRGAIAVTGLRDNVDNSTLRKHWHDASTHDGRGCCWAT